MARKKKSRAKKTHKSGHAHVKVASGYRLSHGYKAVKRKRKK